MSQQKTFPLFPAVINTSQSYISHYISYKTITIHKEGTSISATLIKYKSKIEIKHFKSFCFSLDVLKKSKDPEYQNITSDKSKKDLQVRYDAIDEIFSFMPSTPGRGSFC